MAQKLPKIAKMALKLPKMAQKLAPAKKNSRDISPVSPTFCISESDCPQNPEEAKSRV